MRETANTTAAPCRACQDRAHRCSASERMAQRQAAFRSQQRIDRAAGITALIAVFSLFAAAVFAIASITPALLRTYRPRPATARTTAADREMGSSVSFFAPK